MIIDQNVINELINLTEDGDNRIVNSLEEETFSLKRFLVELKCQVDRWDLIASDYIFHTDLEKDITAKLSGLDYYESTDHLANIWGADLNFTNLIPHDKVLAVDYNSLSKMSKNKSRCVVLGIIDPAKIK